MLVENNALERKALDIENEKDEQIMALSNQKTRLATQVREMQIENDQIVQTLTEKLNDAVNAAQAREHELKNLNRSQDDVNKYKVQVEDLNKNISDLRGQVKQLQA